MIAQAQHNIFDYSTLAASHYIGIIGVYNWSDSKVNNWLGYLQINIGPLL